MENIFLILAMITFILLSIQIIINIINDIMREKYFMKLRSEDLSGKRKNNKGTS